MQASCHRSLPLLRETETSCGRACDVTALAYPLTAPIADSACVWWPFGPSKSRTEEPSETAEKRSERKKPTDAFQTTPTTPTSNHHTHGQTIASTLQITASPLARRPPHLQRPLDLVQPFHLSPLKILRPIQRKIPRNLSSHCNRKRFFPGFRLALSRIRAIRGIESSIVTIFR